MGSNVLLVGAGIGGLVAARALALRGHTVTLAERAPTHTAVGAGIILSFNAMAVLRALGVDLTGLGAPLHGMDTADEQGRTVAHLDLAELGRELGGVYAFHRGELHEALAAALPGTVELRMGAELTGLVLDDAGAHARFADGREGRWDLVVGADGIHSRVRTLAVGEVPLRYSGDTCWRAVVPAPEGQRAEEAWGRDGARFGTVPLPRGRAYVFLVLPCPAGSPTPPWPEFAARFGAFQGLAAQVWPGIRPDALLHHDLNELAHIAWGTPRAWLLGDAAHAMTPNLGQGACMAIEDAAALAQSLGPDLAASFAAYVGQRQARVQRIKDDSARFGTLARLAHPALRWARDTALRLTPMSVNAAALRAAVAPGVELAARWSATGA